ncbi:hypothetical protein PAMP_014419 [Pampus punctatissimus]
MKERWAMGKETVRETKIEGNRGTERVGGKQEEGDHSEGKEEDRKIIRERYAFAHKREVGEKRESGGEGTGDRRGLSPFLHPTLRAPLLDRATSDQPNIRASVPMTELLRLAVPAKGWIPTEYTDEREKFGLSLIALASRSFSWECVAGMAALALVGNDETSDVCRGFLADPIRLLWLASHQNASLE